MGGNLVVYAFEMVHSDIAFIHGPTTAVVFPRSSDYKHWLLRAHRHRCGLSCIAMGSMFSTFNPQEIERSDTLYEEAQGVSHGNILANSHWGFKIVYLLFYPPHLAFETWGIKHQFCIYTHIAFFFKMLGCWTGLQGARNRGLDHALSINHFWRW